ncbi:hypothetical protein KAM385_40550 [Aeromonas hydrophila]|uniref:hypothetical protein n=1 Tax=Aeromonas hydrophila TaxID=644 RepID=UPI001CC78F9B|nr:hypothetical protein [Aeromonas hydrophila]GJC07026.1 hypothetical protein KAM385_40550 [Aeromonas hydrophila]
MTRLQFLLALVAAATFTVSLAHAGTDYRCTVERVYDADGDKSPLIDGQRKLYIGKEFTVERRSGVMVGAGREHTNLKNEQLGQNASHSYKCHS